MTGSNIGPEVWPRRRGRVEMNLLGSIHLLSRTRCILSSSRLEIPCQSRPPHSLAHDTDPIGTSQRIATVSVSQCPRWRLRGEFSSLTETLSLTLNQLDARPIA